MNYYEELGVTQQATEQDIRKAHRRLVKLMHPDAQPDKNLKVLAEAQMRRLNSMVSTLLDPDQRRAYDQQLQSDKDSAETEVPRPTWRGIPWWFASAAGAVVLTLIAVWLWADHLGSAFSHGGRTTLVAAVDTHPLLSGAEIAPFTPVSDSPADPPANSRKAAAPSHDPVGKISTMVVADHRPKANIPITAAASSKPVGPKRTPKTDDQVAKLRRAARGKLSLTARNANRQVASPATSLQAKNSSVQSQSTPVLMASAAPLGGTFPSIPPPPPATGTSDVGHDTESLPASPLPEPVVPAADGSPSGASVSSGPRDPLEGEWVYAPKQPERRRENFYPPEYIDLKLFGAGAPGSLKGEYSAKYMVTDRPVSPEVTFELASIARGSRKFIWQSSNGTKGTLNINRIDDRTIRVDWHTTSAIREPALTSGQATLVRRQ